MISCNMNTPPEPASESENGMLPPGPCVSLLATMPWNAAFPQQLHPSFITYL